MIWKSFALWGTSLVLAFNSGCRANGRQESLSSDAVEKALHSEGIANSWGVTSYRGANNAGNWMIEAHKPKRAIALAVCASELIMLELEEKSSLQPVYKQSDEQVALKSCATASAGDFHTVRGNVNLSELPALLQRLQTAAACADHCADWERVEIEDRLKPYMARIKESSLFEAAERQGDMTLIFLIKDLRGELLACRIGNIGHDGKRALKVTTEPID